MEGLIVCIAVIVLLGGPVALILAMVALSRLNTLRREVDRLQDQMEVLMVRRAEAPRVERQASPEAATPPLAEAVRPSRPARPVEAVREPFVASPPAPPPPPRPPVAAEVTRPLTLDTVFAPPAAKGRPEALQTAEPGTIDSFIAKPSSSSEAASARSSASLEERLGTRFFVWIAAVALALAGAFLVKYTFDRNLLTPTVRIIIGLAFGAALLIVGEWMRSRSARIAQGLSAAGIADIFACLLAAVNLYGLIPPLLGFFLMAFTAGLAVVLALRQGPFVALLGLVGGFLTPALISIDEPQVSLFAYLFVLELGLLAVTRRRGWYLLTGLTLLGSMGWAAVWLVLFFQPEHGVWVGAFLLGSVAAFALASQYGRPEETWGHSAVAVGLTWASAGVGLVLVGALVGVSEFSAIEWAYLGLLGAACMVLGRLDPRQEGLSWLAAVASAALLWAWATSDPVIDQARFGVTTLCLGLLYAIGAYACMWGHGRPLPWASLSVASAIGFLLTAYFVLDRPPWSMRWGALCLIVAVVYTLAAVPVARRRGGRAWEGALAAMAVGVTSLASLAVPIELEREWISVAWAIEVPLLGLIDCRMRMTALRVLAGLLALMVAARLLANPFVLDYPIGEGFFQNWLWYGYGLPAAALASGAWLFHKTRQDAVVVGLAGGSIAFGFALMTLLVRQYFHPGKLGETVFPLSECATWVVLWLAYGWVLLLAARGRPAGAMQWGGRLVAVVALVAMFVLCGLTHNPLWTAQPIGSGQVFNLMLLIYGLPAVLLLLIAAEFRRQDERASARVFGVASLVAVLLLVTMETRQFFHPAGINSPEFSLNEWAALSVAWLVLGYALCLLVRKWPSPTALQAGRLVASIGLLGSLAVCGVVENPLWRHHAVGAAPVFNLLLPIYGLPALLSLLVAYEFRRQGERAGARVVGVVSLLLLFLLITLEVRQGFQGTYLDAPGRTNAEWYTYSVAWLAFGAVLLVIGINTQGVLLRYASLVVVMLAVVKVFLLDTSRLEDLYRVFSFLGLGVSLLVLAYVYQRFVFRAPARLSGEDPAAP